MDRVQFRANAHVIITNCTTRKRQLASVAKLTDRDRSHKTIRQLAQAWTQRLMQQQITVPASSLYLGRSFSDSRSAANYLGGTLFVVSAGLGLVHQSSEVPGYDLTTSGDSGPLHEVLWRTKSKPADWWAELNRTLDQPDPISTLLSERTPAKVLIALPSTYLELIAADLAMVTAECAERLHIFTSAAGKITVPAHLQHCVMPYDDRLEAVTRFAGTRSDFPQRALRHFVEILQGHTLSRHEAHSAVNACLGDQARPKYPERSKASDEEISQLLKQNWSAYGGSSSRLLRYLRSEALVACEQGRFRDLWRAIKSRDECRT